MKKTLIICITVIAGAWACALLSSAPPEPATAYDAVTSATSKTADAKENQRALDMILLSEVSIEYGVIRFNHRAHSLDKKDGGRGIACGTCHHDYMDERECPEQPCSTCHYPSNQGKGPGGRPL
jgi:cytochrome c553